MAFHSRWMPVWAAAMGLACSSVSDTDVGGAMDGGTGLEATSAGDGDGWPGSTGDTGADPTGTDDGDPQGTTGGAGDPAVDAAIEAAIAAMLTLADQHAHALLTMSVLHRRFGVDAFADAGERYLMHADQAAGDVGLDVFTRLVDPKHMVTLDALDALEAPVDRMTGPALYCDRLPLPADYATRLQAGANEGEYGATHAGLSLAWHDELDCPQPAPESVAQDIVAAMARLVDDAGEVADLPIESGAFLHVMGEGDLVPPDWADAVVAAQQGGGSWGATATDSEPSWHATSLALWFLLEVRDEPLEPVVPAG